MHKLYEAPYVYVYIHNIVEPPYKVIRGPELREHYGWFWVQFIQHIKKKKSYLPKNSMKLVSTLQGEGQDHYLPNDTDQTYHLLTLS